MRHISVRFLTKAVLVFACAAMLLFWGGTSVFQPRTRLKQLSVPFDSTSVQLNACHAFLLKRMIGSSGEIFTNYLDAESSGVETRGHSTLSESQGLLMLYAVETGDQRLFESCLNYIRQHMELSSGLIAWRVDSGKPAPENASIDDLRIALALNRAYRRFGSTNYEQTASKLSSALLKSCVNGRYLTGFSGTAGKPADDIILSYLDLNAMASLSGLDTRWSGVRQAGLALIGESGAGSSLPLYAYSYNLKTRSFSNGDNGDYDILGSLLIEYYLTESGMGSSARMNWLKEQCDGSGLFSKYDGKGRPASSVQSTALYALTMLVAKASDNGGLYNSALKRLEAFQVKDTSSPIYGSFGNPSTLQVYSFDNLTALLALSQD